MVRLALANSRMKDFFDIHRLADARTFDGETMRLAVAATFTRRGIDIPGERPLALTSEFADNPQKKVQWILWVQSEREAVIAADRDHNVVACISNGSRQNAMRWTVGVASYRPT